MKYDDNGKVILDNVYDKPDPIDYYSTLSMLDYALPENARPYFARVIAARREAQGVPSIKMVDVGCSYGVNAAILKYGYRMDDLVRHYGSAGDQSAVSLVEWDRPFYGEPADRDIEIVGVDTARNAISYSSRVGILDGGVAADLETAPLEPSEMQLVADADLVVSTGCFGYISEASLGALFEASANRSPWMAHYVLRMYDFAPASEMLADHGYVTELIGEPIRQRRFASPEEREHAMENLVAAGIDPSGLEEDGWYYAQLHLSRPATVAKEIRVAKIFD